MKRENRFIYNFFKVIYSTLLKIIYRPKIIGKENIPKEGSLIFAGNHKHAVDPTVIMSSTSRIVHFLAKEEVCKGLHGKVFDKLGVIRVHRGKANIGAVTEAEEILNNGGTIGIFPEGTRNRTNKELLKFKSGAVRMARDTNSLILPFAIKGEYKLFRKGLILELGKPIDVTGMKIEDANEYLKEQVSNLLRK